MSLNPLQQYSTRVALTTGSGNHLRFVPREFAVALVAAGSAQPSTGSGKVRAVVLTRPATAYAHRIGPPGDGQATGVRFHRWVNLDCGARVVEHHPRCTILSVDDDA